MKRAFTLLEVIIVLVIIGILAAVAIPKIQTNNLTKAAFQIVRHIRYTQHLALVNDSFDPKDRYFYKRYWQIYFTHNGYTNDEYVYSIFSSSSPSGDSNPNLSDFARDPLTGKRMTGGYSGVLYSNDPRTLDDLKIGSKYGIQDIKFSSNCHAGNSKKIYFDSLGRPYTGSLNTSSTNSYALSFTRLLKQECTISFCTRSCNLASNDEKIEIVIEPLTGYTYIKK